MTYTEKSSKAWSAVCIGVYLAGIGYMGVETLPDDFGVWLGVSGLFLLLLLPCLAVPISKRIYHRIEIDATTLRVGRERLPLTDIDPASVRAAAQGQLPTAPQHTAANPRLVGGAWGVPMGMDTVIIATRRGEFLTVATRDRAAFLQALSAPLHPAVPPQQY
ncbi:DUF3093 family protein [Streptomyces alboflavus]|uniref:Uncharacterized protein n=1 Tax=Streptomyces alboflavus TaxID=67267 RepID=A0A1Z1WGK7_9ACTN|nr:DUF3093 family protein [Streptomyces alboflavus]ARX85586.1 hypothetical protein SMD44_05050 [Streptomyces alboflavus]